MKQEKNKTRQMSETFLMGTLLALTGGFLDAYTYISRGGVFANAQTGNIVLLGLNMASGQWSRVLYYLVPIIAFVLGIFLAESIRGKCMYNRKMHWRQLVLILEILVLLFVAVLPQGKFDMIANVAVSFICAMQVESFRKVNGNTFATTMCTGNLRSGTERLYRFGRTGEVKELEKSLQYYGIILIFIIGAMAGMWLTKQFAQKAVLFACGMLFMAFLMMFVRSEEDCRQ
ncbi:YoaK family protein [Coprococcus sp. AF21-14LB]|uniref:YoaK family protein n=1 Tax=Coprococcus sp. AF21-14LB TaxID=2292231 RepID=UPI001FA8D93F|nr:YoaK family protein [Coprococcus sp. AF21-14LB]